jgi:hypothetical protein
VRKSDCILNQGLPPRWAPTLLGTVWVQATKLSWRYAWSQTFDDTRATVSSTLHPLDMKLAGSGWQPCLEPCGPRGIRGRMPWGLLPPLQPLNDILCGPFGRATIKANDDAGIEVSAAAPIEDPPPPGNPGIARVLPDLQTV